MTDYIYNFRTHNGGGNGQYTYYVSVTGSPNAATYSARTAAGAGVGSWSDTATTSGLKALLSALSGDNVHFHFGPGRFHFLDAPLGNEAWAGDQDHAVFGTASPSTKGLTFTGAGMRATIISNRTNWSGAADTEPLAFTNCQYVTIRDLTIEGCGSSKTTTDAIDFDQGCFNQVERVRITASRSRGIVIDGGDDGRWAGGNVIRDCKILGRPERPECALVAGGSLTSGTTYRYVVAYEINDLGGAGVVAETKPSEEAKITPSGGNLSVRLQVPIGPYTTTSRKIYRAPAGSAAWVLLTTIADNTTATYTDTGGAGSGVTMPVATSSTIQGAGIELLGATDNLVLGNHVDGVGAGSTGYGINSVRKGTAFGSDRNRILGNTVRNPTSHGIRVAGSSSCLVANNHVLNPGTVASKAQAIRIEGIASAVTDKNTVTGNRCQDDQDANSWSGGQSMNNVITINSTGTPTSNLVAGNYLTAGASATTISDAGTTSIVKDNVGYNPLGFATITPGASPYTYTAGSTPEMVYISGGTVTSITRGGSALGIVAGSVLLEPNQALVVTYSVAPTMNKDRL